MPSFRSKLLSACAWIAPILAAALPTQHLQPETRLDGKLVHLDFQPNYAQATFSIPCAGCLGHHHTGQASEADESLSLSFTSHALYHACGSSNITLNGQYLRQEWVGDFASGAGSYSGVSDLDQNDCHRQHDLDLEWESACLRGPEETDETAQLLSVYIKAVNGKTLTTPFGFTVSFQQHTSPPALLRIESIPNSTLVSGEIAESWRTPPHHLRLLVSESANDELKPHTLEEDILELKALQAELQHLQLAIADKRKYIHSQIQKEAATFSEELNQCDSVGCVARTFTGKAQRAWKVVQVSLQSNKATVTTMGRPEGLSTRPQGSPQGSRILSGQLKADTSSPPPYDLSPNELPPHPASPSPCIIALEITLSLFCCSCLVAVVRHKCSSLRTRTERAAAREERMNVQAYRRAARQHAWRNWWRGNWARKDQERIMDYEEKQALIHSQEHVLEDAVQEEIRQLRAAHNVVNDLIREAEEGRGVNHTPSVCYDPQPRALYSPLSTASTYPPTSLPEIPSRSPSRTDSLPSYHSDSQTEPPSYESEEETSDVVANGFRGYVHSTASEASSHWTPDSSVVDVSPRPSADTLRYPQSLLTCDEEDEEDDG